MDILGLVDFPLWLLLFFGVLLLLYVYGTWSHTVWVSQSVPGPKPWPLLGNLPEVQNKTHFRVYAEWQQKYGRVIGYFTGVRPALVVTDLDMVREVMVKQFNNFTDRNMVRGTRPRIVDKALFFAGSDIWKRIRSLMTPAFSTSKLKVMSHYVSRCSDLLVKSVDSKARADQLIDVKDLFGAFTMDVIAGTAFGLETNSQTQVEEPFVQHCKELFNSTSRAASLLRFIIYFVNMFPSLARLVSGIGFGSSAGPRFFFAALESMVDDRRQQGHAQDKKAADLLQMLVEAEADPESAGDHAHSSGDAASNRRMTKEEVIAQGFIVLIAGYETTATTLQYLTYNMALHPHIQEKVFREIQDKLGEAKPTYENVSQLKYLDATIRETLRAFPPVGFVDRRAQKPTTINGVHIPAGCGVTIPIHCILHDPEYFPQPDVFDPDRFLEENLAQIHPVTVELPFGYGPRKCIGMRLAFLEVKMAAAQLLRQFRFVKCAETPEKINISKTFALAMPDVVIKVKAEVRGA